MKKLNCKRMKTRDAAFKFRMGAGYPGDLTRTNPTDVFPELADTTNQPTKSGQGVIIDGTSKKIRKLITGDGVDTIALYGITVRTFPFQQAATGVSSYDGSSNYGSVGFGGDSLPVTPEVDVLRRGSIIVKVPTGQTPAKGGAVYIWNVADAAGHTQGDFEATDGTTNTILVTNAVWNSGVDANGNAELVFNI